MNVHGSMMYFILSKLVKEENFMVRHIDLHSMRFGIGDHKAFTLVGKCPCRCMDRIWTGVRRLNEEDLENLV